jgi:hypothetical protein
MTTLRTRGRANYLPGFVLEPEGELVSFIVPELEPLGWLPDGLLGWVPLGGVDGAFAPEDPGAVLLGGLVVLGACGLVPPPPVPDVVPVELPPLVPVLPDVPWLVSWPEVPWLPPVPWLDVLLPWLCVP